ncbi:hypothetical protein [Asticcacaulis sp.]|uniref:hypothetical protein n=1 Tax=Asticcacaulis sp. TaxID=1872648 RepID=UPI003F7C6980
MTNALKLWFAAAMTGFMLMMAPVVQAQAISEPDAATRTDLYARIKVAGFATPVDIRQSGMKTRVDLTAGGVPQSYIADREKGVLISLTATGQNRLALVFPLDRTEGILPLPLDLSILARQSTLKVVGASLVSGHPCRLMEFSGYLNQSGMVCASSDNIILQMTQKGRRDALFEVLELSAARQDPKWFRTPPDYQVAVVPGIGGASGDTGLIEQPQPPGVIAGPKKP